jgi:hypothetical protein
MQNTYKKNILNNIGWLGTFLFPLGLFFFILLINIPNSVIRVINNYKIVQFILLVILFNFCFRLGGKASWAMGLSLTAIIFALPLTANWSAGISTTKIIGGLIPYKDGFYYYNSARMLLSGQVIPAEGLQGAFRPLYPGLLSILLLLTNHNLLWTQALMVMLSAICCYLAVREVNIHWGTWPAAFFITILYFFIFGLIGLTLTEMPSLDFSCLAFILLLRSARSQKYVDLILGSLLLIIAISVRAGAFFMVPFLILWIGWIFRKGNKLAFAKMGIFILVFIVEFAFANIIFPRLVTAPDTSTFGNFSWMLYGQAVGGAGWTYHYQVLGTHDAAIVMQAAIDRIFHYPLGIIIASLKSFRDFFAPGQIGIFNLISRQSEIIYILFWVINISLMIIGLIYVVRNYKNPLYSLLLACFIGIILSIPFLPPIDGGMRFYSGSLPFFFIIEVVGLFAFLKRFKLVKPMAFEEQPKCYLWIRIFSIILSVLILIVPLIVLLTRKSPMIQVNQCSQDQISFAVHLYDGTYIDILPVGSSHCGHLPELCINDFEKNGTDKVNDDFFRKLVELAGSSPNGIRLSAVNDLVSSQYYFIVGPIGLLSTSKPDHLITGCAKKIPTQFQKVLLVQTNNP